MVSWQPLAFPCPKVTCHVRDHGKGPRSLEQGASSSGGATFQRSLLALPLLPTRNPPPATPWLGNRVQWGKSHRPRVSTAPAAVRTARLSPRCSPRNPEAGNLHTQGPPHVSFESWRETETDLLKGLCCNAGPSLSNRKTRNWLRTEASRNQPPLTETCPPLA